MAAHRPSFTALRDAALSTPGALPAQTRQAAFEGGPLPEPMASLAEKMRTNASMISDEDVLALKAAGHSDDAIFELIVATAVGAAEKRLNHALALLHGDRS